MTRKRDPLVSEYGEKVLFFRGKNKEWKQVSPKDFEVYRDDKDTEHDTSVQGVPDKTSV